MLNKIFGQPQISLVTKRPAKRDIVVRLISPNPGSKKAFIEAAEIVNDYKEEEKIFKHLNLAQGLTVGGGIGLLICALAQVVGLTLSLGDMAAFIGIPATLGVIAGYIFS